MVVAAVSTTTTFFFVFFIIIISKDRGKYAPAPDNGISCFQDKDRFPPPPPAASSPPSPSLHGPARALAGGGRPGRGGNNGEVSGEFWLRPACVGAAPSPCRIAVRRK